MAGGHHRAHGASLLLLRGQPAGTRVGGVVCGGDRGVQSEAGWGALDGRGEWGLGVPFFC